jgi:hypothetical protein
MVSIFSCAFFAIQISSFEKVLFSSVAHNLCFLIEIIRLLEFDVTSSLVWCKSAIFVFYLNHVFLLFLPSFASIDIFVILFCLLYWFVSYTFYIIFVAALIFATHFNLSHSTFRYYSTLIIMGHFGESFYLFLLPIF